MLSDQLLTQLRTLSNEDKLRVIQLLANDLAEDQTLLQANATYDVWSPFDAPDAVAKLSQMLDDDTPNE